MRYLVFGDIQCMATTEWSRPTSTGETEYLTLCMKTFLWLREQGEKHDVDGFVFLGDMFEKNHSIDVRALHVATQGMNLLHADELWFTCGNHGKFSRLPDVTAENIFQRRWSVVNSSYAHPRLPIAFIGYDQTDVIQSIIDTLPEPFVIFGHFDVKGAMMNSSLKCDKGPAFKRGHRAIVGHHHHPEKVGNVYLIGAPFHRNWTDTRTHEGRGAAIVEIDEGGLRSVQRLINPHTPYFVTLRGTTEHIEQALKSVPDPELTFLKIYALPEHVKHVRTQVGAFRGARVIPSKADSTITIPERDPLKGLDLDPSKIIAGHALMTETDLDRKRLIKEGEQILDR